MKYCNAYLRKSGHTRKGEPFLVIDTDEGRAAFMREYRLPFWNRWRYRWEFIPVEAALAQYQGMLEVQVAVSKKYSTPGDLVN